MLNALILLLAKAQEAAPKGGGEGPPAWTTFLPIILIFVVFYFMIIMPARKRERAQREMLERNLKKNDEVLTSAGIIGIVANIKDDEVTLKVDESSNVRMRVLKSSIVKIMTPPGEAKDGKTEAIRAGS